MKKALLFFFVSLTGLTMKAQYFQHDYGTAQTNDVLESGVNTNFPATAQGHLMTGYTINPAGVSVLMVTRTNLNGAIIGTFNNRYPIAENNVQVSARGRRIVHLGSQNIGVWGDYGPAAATLSNKFFYAQLNPAGVILSLSSYTLPANVVEAEATSMCISPSTPDTIYTCGFVRYVAGGPRFPIIMCLNANNGGIAWTAQYQSGTNDWTAMDIVKSPYADPSFPGVTMLALCGHFTVPGSPESGCFFRVNAVNGAFIPNIITYGTSTNNGAFNAIDIANNPYNGGTGFVMGGYYNNPLSGTDDSWAMKVNFNGTVVHFSTVHDYNPAPNNDYANDIIERFSTTLAQYEYYLGGYAVNGVFGLNDAIVYKLDFKGNPFGGGDQFTYGGHGNDRCLQLDQYNTIGPNNNGLSVYGTTSNSFPGLGLSDMYLVKAYFNGFAPCSFDIRTHTAVAGPGILLQFPATVPSKFSPGPLISGSNTMQDFQICFSATVTGGDNTRHAAPENELTAPGYFPNPVSHDNAVVTVTFGKAAVEGEAELELWNSLGQLCWSKKASVSDGQTQMEVQLGNELNGGMYHLIVKQNGEVNNYRIVVQ